MSRASRQSLAGILCSTFSGLRILLCPDNDCDMSECRVKRTFDLPRGCSQSPARRAPQAHELLYPGRVLHCWDCRELDHVLGCCPARCSADTSRLGPCRPAAACSPPRVRAEPAHCIRVSIRLSACNPFQERPRRRPRNCRPQCRLALADSPRALVLSTLNSPAASIGCVQL